jgi:hypothetical protein
LFSDLTRRWRERRHRGVTHYTRTFVFYVIMVLGAILLIGYGSAAVTAVATRFRHLSFVRPLYIRLRADAIAHARLHRIASEHTTANQAMQLTASKPAVYASSVCRRERMLRGMHRGLAAADLVSR